MQRIRFIVNPISGGQDKTGFSETMEKLLDHSRFAPEVKFTERAGHATELAKEAAEQGFDIVAAVGGDGSLNEVAAGLLGTGTALAVIPGGSGNGFAMNLGMGRSIKKGLKMLNTTERRCIDMVRLNGKPFVNVSGIGFDAKIAYRFQESKSRGFINYFRIAMEEAYHAKCNIFEIRIDDKEPITREALLVVAANATSFGYDFKVAPAARMDDGLLELVLANKRPKPLYFLAAPRMITGNLDSASFYERHSCKKVEITFRDDTYVHIDGEGFPAPKKLVYEIIPEAIDLMVPTTKKGIVKREARFVGEGSVV